MPPKKDEFFFIIFCLKKKISEICKNSIDY